MLLALTNNPKQIGKADFIIIYVPTPLTKSKELDLSYVESVARIKGDMKKGSVVILGSTIYPGVTKKIIKPIPKKEQVSKMARIPKLLAPWRE